MCALLVFRLVVAYKSQSAGFGKSDKLLPSFKCSFLSIWRKRYLLEILSQLFLIKMKLAVLTVALLLCAVLATTVTAAPTPPSDGKNFSCFYMLLYPCSFYLSWHHAYIQHIVTVTPSVAFVAASLVALRVNKFRPSVNQVLYLTAST